MTPGDSEIRRRRSVLARLSRARTAARRSTRASASTSRPARRTCGTHSSSTTIRSKARCRASSSSTASTRRRSASATCRSTRAWPTARRSRRATSALRFEGGGVRLDSIDIAKSSGRVTGAAYVGWDGNYSFNADGTQDSRRVAEDRVVAACAAVGCSAVQRDRERHVRGAALRREAHDRRPVRRRRRHRAADRRLALRGELLTRRARSGLAASGGVGLGPNRADTDEMDAELMIRFNETSLDPVRALLRAAAVAVHERGRRRHDSRRRRAGGSRSHRRRSDESSSSISSCSITAAATTGRSS